MTHILNVTEHWPEAVSDGLTLPCFECGQVPQIDYHVAEWVWRACISIEHRGDVLCLPCFLKLITRHNRVEMLAWVDEIQLTVNGETLVLAPSLLVRYEQEREP